MILAAVLEGKQPGRSNQVWNETISTTRHITQKRRLLQDYEVAFVVDERSTNQKAFDFALETAKRFETRILLVYTIPRREVPPDYVEYARVEGIRDYAWHYSKDISNSKVENLARRAEEAGIEWSTRVHFGDTKTAVRSLIGDKRMIVVVNKNPRKSWLNSISALFSREDTEFAIPVMVV